MTPEQLQNLAEFEFKAAKQTLLERVDSQLAFTYKGGLFKATPYLLAEIAGYLTMYNVDEQIVMMDEYQNPTVITLGVFRTMALEARQYALNAYATEFEKLKKVRKGDKI